MRIEVPSTVLGTRLQQARKRAGLTQQEVAEKLGMARTTIVAIEKGERALRAEELISIAKLFHVDLHDLLRNRPEVGPISLQFRAGVVKDGVDVVEDFTRRVVEDYLWLEAQRSAPMRRALPAETAIGDSPERSARMAAEDERMRLGLGIGPIASVRELLEERIGVRVFLTPPGMKHTISGAYFWDVAAGPVAIVSGAHHWTRRRWSACHELGHVIGSRHSSSTMTSDYDPFGDHGKRQTSEDFADAFARYFLMPASYLERFVTDRKGERGGKFLVSDIAELAGQLGVSLEACARALEDEGLVKKGATAYILGNGYRSEATDDHETYGLDRSSAVVSRRFQRLALATYACAEITEGSLAAILRTGREDVRRLVSSAESEQLRHDLVRGAFGG